MFPRGSRRLLALAALIVTAIILLSSSHSREAAKGYIEKLLDKDKEKDEPPKPLRPNPLPEPDWSPPPVQDPFPELPSFALDAIPPWNVPRKDLHADYGLSYAPPLFIGFTRTWPILLQAVVSYVTAGWPADQIYVVENTGVQWANARGKLTLQNPFYLNHEHLAKLGVNVIRAPVLMNFAQLQNFYVHLAHENEWPYFFWSHMDVIALSYEDGMEGLTPPADQPGYKTLYELALQSLNATLGSDERWADKFFAYDHLTLVNRQAYDDIGGWDTFIPYYMTDCDMHSRLLMEKYTQNDARAGMVFDVNTVLKDLKAFYRDTSVAVDFLDPNPPRPPPPDKKNGQAKRDDTDVVTTGSADVEEIAAPDTPVSSTSPDTPADTTSDSPSDSPTETRVRATQEDIARWRNLRDVADRMTGYKHGERGRNTWQVGQHGGEDEPYYYPARGIAEGIDVMTEAGREVFRRKWGHRDCDLPQTGYKLRDQWRMAPDWQ